MPHLEINPRYQTLLERQGLRAPEDFLALPAVIISGHPDRNAARVELGCGQSLVKAFLKREHRVRLKDRLLNACAGFGFVSKSRRECRMLESLAVVCIPCADWIAVGETSDGKAFLLLREMEGTSDLRVHLRDVLRNQPRRRRRFALRLGDALARLHNTGFDHPDLYSKHISVDEDGPQIYFLDVQRSRWRKNVSWARRWSDLAALDATLSEELLPTDDRLACLRAYLRACRIAGKASRAPVLQAAFRIVRNTRVLLSQRRIQETRQGPRPQLAQELIWLDGEALCVRPPLQALYGAVPPDWLKLSRLPGKRGPLLLDEEVTLGDGQPARLIRRREIRLFGGLWSFLRRKELVSPELRQSGILFRLERAGVRTPRLLAFGQRQAMPWLIEALLLTKIDRGTSLRDWRQAIGFGCAQDTETATRRRLIGAAGRLMRDLHHAGCYFAKDAHSQLILIPSDAASPTNEPALSLAASAHIVTKHRPSHTLATANLRMLRDELGDLFRTRTDKLRFVLYYLGVSRLNGGARRLARSFLPGADQGKRRTWKCSLREVAWITSPLAGRGVSS